MIAVEKAKHTSGVILSGDFFDFDRLYFAIMKFTGSHGLNDECPFPDCEETCENLLGLCYELRHAWQGQRNLEQVYNGVSADWFENQVSDYDDYNENDDFDSEETKEKWVYFSRSEFPDVTTSNTYFSTVLSFPEIIFYALITSDLLKKKESFVQSRKRMAEENGALQEFYKEYYYFGAEEDIARITLFTKHVLHALYQFVGEEKYFEFINMFNDIDNFSASCDLKTINDLLIDYAEKKYVQDDPDILMSVLSSIIKS